MSKGLPQSTSLDQLIPKEHIQSVKNGVLANIVTSHITADSRKVKQGSVFFAISGLTVDGHQFISQAIAKGAAVVVVDQRMDSPIDFDVPTVTVDNSARAFASALAQIWRRPADSLKMVGITGTNGKTTVSFLVNHVIGHAGIISGLIGTVESQDGQQVRQTGYTTPPPELLHPLLANMVSSNCQVVVMETSSHGLALDRLWGCFFKVAAFTQLSQDHLDLHGTEQNYLAAKLRLFNTHLAKGGIGVVNLDGRASDQVLQTLIRQKSTVVTCSTQTAQADVFVEVERCTAAGLTGRLHIGDSCENFSSPLLGGFNAENIAVAAGCCHALGLPLNQISAGLATAMGAPGRLERVTTEHSVFDVFIDFAHTPDALARVTRELKQLCPHGRLIVAFGCGGDRDSSKRPKMAQAVAQHADQIIVTSDNPRSESPTKIISDTVVGLNKAHQIEPDRQQAIKLAIELAKPGDIVLIAGKGHERYQIVGDQTLPFDDCQWARHYLEQSQAQTGRRRS